MEKTLNLMTQILERHDKKIQELWQRILILEGGQHEQEEQEEEDDEQE